MSLIVEDAGAGITWRDFGYENNYYAKVHTEGYEGVGPFVFDRTEYRAALKKVLSARPC